VDMAFASLRGDAADEQQDGLEHERADEPDANGHGHQLAETPHGDELAEHQDSEAADEAPLADDDGAPRAADRPHERRVGSKTASRLLAEPGDDVDAAIDRDAQGDGEDD